MLSLLAFGAVSSLASSSSPAVSSAGTIVVENQTLGYRLTLPERYRVSGTTIVPGSGSFVGRAGYTLLSPAEEQAFCLRDNNGTPSPDGTKTLSVEVFLDPANASALEWAKGSHLRSARVTVEAASAGNLDAARFVADGKSFAYAIRANQRIYVLTPDVGPSIHPLDSIASTFVAIAPSQRPALAPDTTPRDAAVRLGTQLADAFATAIATRHVDAVSRLMRTCIMSVAPYVDGQPLGGVLNRSIPSFLDGLQAGFSAGTLTVVVDPKLQTGRRSDGSELYFVRSVWTNNGRSINADLYLDSSVIDGRALWIQSSLQFRQADVVLGCIPYPSPWVAGGASC
jgi:hypothetical protein